MTFIASSMRPGKSGLHLLALAMLTLVAACNDGDDPMPESAPVVAAPTVAQTVPASATPAPTGIDVHSQIRATFSTPMLASTLTNASFTLACPVGAPVQATVGYDAASSTATLTPTQALPPSTSCQADISTAVQDSAGVPLANAYQWSFSTGAALALDTVRPTVTFSVPAGGSIGVATNTALSVGFSEDMDAASFLPGSFTLTNTTLGTAVPGSVSYSAAARSLTFTPSSPSSLAADSQFSATISAGVTDKAGNALAGNQAVFPASGSQVWSFTTGSAPDLQAPTVLSVSPSNASSGVCVGKSINASFSEAMNAASLNETSFRVTDGGATVAGRVSYDASSRIATFTPTAAAGLTANHEFVVVLAGGNGAMDLAGNALSNAYLWSFSTNALACTPPLATVNLGAAASFGILANGAGVGNQGLRTVVNGHVGSTAACSLVTGLHDANQSYTETAQHTGLVNGSVHCAPPAPGSAAALAVANQARADAQLAYNALVALGSSPGAISDRNQLGGYVLIPGVYTAFGDTFSITHGDLTLDAQGDPNAQWVFRAAGQLNVGVTFTPIQVRLINGAQARNVFWQVGGKVQVMDGSGLVGTVIAQSDISFSTPEQVSATTRLTGRAISLNGGVTLVNTVILAP